MTHTTQNRSKLLLGTGCVAMAMGMLFSAEKAQAQAIQATESFVVGTGDRQILTLGSETILIDTPTAVIDWTPDEDGAGNALDFLPTGNDVTFENGVNIPGQDFAVLNRILPSTNGNVAVIDGIVVSQIRDALGTATPGGTVAFYSPTGLFIGDNAVFDVGNLILTTLDIDLASFDAFTQSGGTLSMALGPNGPQSITINPGATFTATAENSYFVVTAAEIQMFGTSDINGSQAFVAGDEVLLTLNNGLFDIQVPVGTSSLTPIDINGDVGGPSSTGAGDNHIIYAVAAAQNDPISLLFSGNLGFEPAASAGIVNGEVIISANYNVFGRSVDGAQLSSGINQEFFEGFGGGPVSDTAGNIFLSDFNSSSSIIAVANDQVDASAVTAGSFVDGDLFLFGKSLSRVSASNGQTFDITGDLLASVNDAGDTGSGVIDPLDANAQAGDALIEAFAGGTINVGGTVRANAVTRAGRVEPVGVIGSEQGGTATLRSDGGTINVNGDVFLDAGTSNSSFGFTIGTVNGSGGDSIGGTADLVALNGGSIIIDGVATVDADATGNTLTEENDGVGTVGIGGFASIRADTGGLISIGLDANIGANGNGGFNPGGVGGVGGVGGDGFAGVASLTVGTGTISIGGNANINAVGIGANASGFSIISGGTGGNGTGGLALLSAEGTLTEIGEIIVNGFTQLNASGLGGVGGFGDGASILAGAGGDGFGGSSNIALAIDPAQTGGAFLTAGVDNGQLTLTGGASALSDGDGGVGGNGGAGQAGGLGGNGTAGFVQSGLALLGGGDGSVGQGFFNVSDLNQSAQGRGGTGGFGGSTGDPRGDGGDATGGVVELIADGGTLTAGLVNQFAAGQGGNGANGGDALGGTASLLGSGGAALTFTNLTSVSSGAGGFGETGAGGNGVGGLTQARLADASVQVTGQVFLSSDATGGAGDAGRGGDATGGQVDLDTNDPNASFVGDDILFLRANANAGQSNFAGTGATATGGTVNVFADAGGTVSALATGLFAQAFGGGNTGTGDAGDAFGGRAFALAADDGTFATTTTNVVLTANATGGAATGGGAGGDATGGEANFLVGLPSGSVGNANIGTSLSATATATGGSGIGGGDATGGFAVIQVQTGQIDAEALFASASGQGGDSTSAVGFGGDGGNGTGGLAIVGSFGAAGRTAAINLTNGISVQSNGTGGAGGIGDGSAIAPGLGGNGFGGSSRTLNAVFTGQTNGAFIFISDVNSTINAGDTSIVNALGIGGLGGTGGLGQAGGDGGNGFGGNAFFGNSGLLTDDADDLNDGTSIATVAGLTLDNSGIGGNAGFGGSTTDPQGDGGSGSAGITELNVSLDQASIVAAGVILDIGDAFLISNGTGGAGDVGGSGFGGVSSVSATSGGEVTLLSVSGQSQGFGGDGRIGGAGNGGGAADPGEVNGGTGIGFRNGTVTITGDANFNASGFGGASTGGDGGAGNGGFVTFQNSGIGAEPDLQGDLTVGGFASLLAEGFGGDGTEDFPGGPGSGGVGTGGLARLVAVVGGTILLDSAQIAAGGLGGSGSLAAGGDGIGGEASITSDGAGSDITITNGFDFQNNIAVTSQSSLLSAVGTGGIATGGTGVGGDAFGGTINIIATDQASIALPLNPTLGSNRILGRAVGGASAVDGGLGGFATAGTGLIFADNAEITTGATLFSVFATGGSSTQAFDDVQTINVDGGDAIGGDRRFTIINGSTLTGEFFGGTAAGVGGNASGTGNGGSGQGGRGVYTFEDSTFNAVGRNVFGGGGGGGNGVIGGNASGGDNDFVISNSTINLISNGQTVSPSGLPDTPSFQIFNQNLAGDGTSQGGNAVGGAIDVSITNSTITGGSFGISDFARAGSADLQSGTGGNATSGSITFVVNDSTLEVRNGEDVQGFDFDPATGMQVPGEIFPGRISEIVSVAQAGAGLIGGNAASGDIVADFTGGSVVIDPSSTADGVLEFASRAIGGNGTQSIGNSSSGLVGVTFNATAISGDILSVRADADSALSEEAVNAGSTADGGIAIAGIASLNLLDNTAVLVDELAVSADAITSAGGEANGGSASLRLGDGFNSGTPRINTPLLTVSGDGSGASAGAGDNRAGRFAIEVLTGVIETVDLDASATGDALAAGEAGPSLITARNGLILASNQLNADSFDDLIVRTLEAGRIGDLDEVNPQAQISLTSQGTLVFNGDNDDFVGVVGSVLELSSSDIIINEGARIGAPEVILNSLNLEDPAVLGGDGMPGGNVDGEGYTLIGEELERIEVDVFTFNQGALANAGPNDPSLIVRDYTASGSLGDGPLNASLNVNGDGGILRVEGSAVIADAGLGDSLALSADERIEIVTPGGVGVVDLDGNPTGAISLDANNIWAADADTIALLQNDPNFEGRNELLSSAAEGSDDPLGYIRAGEVGISFGETLLVRNTGTEDAQGGILVGDGGLFISKVGLGTGDVFAYGARLDPSTGELITGEAFFDEVNFSGGEGGLTFTDASAVNNCLINSGECITPSSGPTEEEEVVQQEAAQAASASAVEAATQTATKVAASEEETDEDFGMDFPSFVETEETEDEGDIDDPVASGGDASLYGRGANGSIEVGGASDE